MSSILGVISSFTGFAVGAILAPAAALPKGAGLICVSLLAGVGMVFLYGKFSNQNRIKGVKEKISAGLLECVLYRHEPTVCLAAQGKMLRYSCIYFLSALPALVALCVPTIFLLADLNTRFGLRPFKQGEEVLLEIQTKPGEPEPRIVSSKGFVQEGGVRIPSGRATVWRLRAAERGAGEIRISSGGREVRKTVFVEEDAPVIVAANYAGWWRRVLFPDKDNIAGGFVRKLEVSYPGEDYWLLGLRMHWVLVFLIVSLLSGIIGSRFLRIEI